MNLLGSKKLYLDSDEDSASSARTRSVEFPTRHDPISNVGVLLSNVIGVGVTHDQVKSARDNDDEDPSDEEDPTLCL